MNKQGYIEERVLRKIDFVNKCISPKWGYIDERLLRKIDYVNKSLRPKWTARPEES